jgi:futalosine hydrolase
MKILIVSATVTEISPLLEKIFKTSDFPNQTIETQSANDKITFLITGIGIASSIYRLVKMPSLQQYDLVLNVGICGTFSDDLEIGTIVNVVSDEFADCGTEDNSGFHTLFDIEFLKPDEFPFKSGRLEPNYDTAFLSSLKKVNAITVNRVSGTENTILERRKKFSPQIETMEGAAVFYVCLSEKIPVVQIRAISNRVEIRDKNTWNIPLAVKNLNQFLEQIILEL